MLRLYLSFTEENSRIRQIPTNHKNELTKNKVKKKCFLMSLLLYIAKKIIQYILFNRDSSIT